VRVGERYLALTVNQLVKVWWVNVRLEPQWLTFYFAQSSGELVAVADWTRAACYDIFPWPLDNPNEGNRQLVCDPWLPATSPKGWQHHYKFADYHTTEGNNVHVQIHDTSVNWTVSRRPVASVNANQVQFAFPLDLSQPPVQYTDAALTNLFYHCNMMHDLLYVYGFTEVAGNFQDDNFGRGGREEDSLVAYGQGTSSINNAYFSTPPDGSHPYMYMFLWNMTGPNRDGCLDRSVVAHEYTHGLTARLTGGPINVYCLLFGEAAGLSEGWSDWVATVLQVRPYPSSSTAVFIPTHLDQVVVVGAYVTGKPTKGIRTHPYTTNMATNPTTYAWLNRANYKEIHSMGEVWTQMLYEVFWNFVGQHGFNTNWFSGDPSAGNTLALQLVIDALKLQPCFPEFISARDAILQAEKQRTMGTNRCLIWKGFAKRGLGEGAKRENDTYIESFHLPQDC
ncbi:peptidase M36, partial [Dimargaris cristalligena]